MRLFIAIDLSRIGQELQRLQSQIDESAATLKKTDTYHLTLKFLGKVSEENADHVKEKLRQVDFNPFKLSLDKVGTFPNEDFIRVIWIGIKPSKEIVALQEKIEKALEEFNFKKDYEFSPHITLARVKMVNDRDAFKKNMKELTLPENSVQVTDFRLICSKLTPKGPIYEDVEVYKAG